MLVMPLTGFCQVQSEKFFNYDFEGEVDTAFTTAIGGQEPSIKTEDDTGNKYFHVDYKTTTQVEYAITKNFVLSDATKIEYGFDIRFNSDCAAAYQNIILNLIDKNNGSVVPAKVKVNGFAAGKKTNTGVNDEDTYEAPFNPGEWYSVRVIADIEEETVTVYRLNLSVQDSEWENPVPIIKYRNAVGTSFAEGDSCSYRVRLQAKNTDGDKAAAIDMDNIFVREYNPTYTPELVYSEIIDGATEIDPFTAGCRLQFSDDLKLDNMIATLTDSQNNSRVLTTSYIIDSDTLMLDFGGDLMYNETYTLSVEGITSFLGAESKDVVEIKFNTVETPYTRYNLSAIEAEDVTAGGVESVKLSVNIPINNKQVSNPKETLTLLVFYDSEGIMTYGKWVKKTIPIDKADFTSAELIIPSSDTAGGYAMAFLFDSFECRTSLADRIKYEFPEE